MSAASNGNARRDIIVIGASWGGVDALIRIASLLPHDLPASLFIVLHVAADSPSVLPHLLERAGPLPARHPADGDPIRPAEIYVAPPDCHLLLERGVMRLSGAARENRCRPAVDPLFRSAANAYGERVAGVILTGAQDDGTAGMLRIKARGGVTIVQDPTDAFCGDMPRSALAHVEIDYCLPLAAIPDVLVRLATEEVETLQPPSAAEGALMAGDDEFNRTPSQFTCPDCNGTLWMSDGEVVEFRCRVGHRYTLEHMIAAQVDSVERAQWAALRALEEKAELHRRLAARTRSRRVPYARFEETARDAEQQAAVLRELLANTKT